MNPPKDIGQALPCTNPYSELIARLRKEAAPRLRYVGRGYANERPNNAAILIEAADALQAIDDAAKSEAAA